MNSMIKLNIWIQNEWLSCLQEFVKWWDLNQVDITNREKYKMQGVPTSRATGSAGPS